MLKAIISFFFGISSIAAGIIQFICYVEEKNKRWKDKKLIASAIFFIVLGGCIIALGIHFL